MTGNNIVPIVKQREITIYVCECGSEKFLLVRGKYHGAVISTVCSKCERERKLILYKTSLRFHND